MVRILFILFIVPGTVDTAYSINIDRIRKLYYHAVSNKDSCKSLINDLKVYDESNNTTLAGYKACAHMIMAKHLINPISKYSYFRDGKGLLEKCINKDINNYELRFLRFSIQSNIPGFLGYKDAINADKNYLLNGIKQIKDSNLKGIIATYLKTSSLISNEDKLLLDKLI